MKPAQRINQLPSSYIREILAAANTQETISLAGGLPDESCFPLALMADAYKALADQPVLFQYASSRGYQPLLAHLTQAYQLNTTAQVLLTSGSQQGLDLMARAYLNQGDSIALEAPSYLGALQVFRLAQAQVHSVQQNPDGPDLVALEALFQRQKIKIFYTVPDFHNPTGICYSLAVRKAIATLCIQYNVLLLEDVPYRELRFSGEQLPLIASFCPEQAIVLRSFSKIACPGLRIGAVHGPEEIINNLLKVKQVCDLQGSQSQQAVLLSLLQHNDYEAHLVRLRRRYADKQNQLISCIEKTLGDATQVRKVEGGMFLWLEIIGGEVVDVEDVAERCLANQVAVVPGSVFYDSAQYAPYLRLNFSHGEAGQFAPAIEVLKAALDAQASCASS